nr:metallophosphoesterase [Sphingomonas formosensis]
MIKRFGLAVLALALALLGYGVVGAMADPIVRHATIGFPDWPSGAAPLRVALLSDIHASRPDLSPARLARIVAQVNALRPDLIVITGDFMSTKSIALPNNPPAKALAPLAGLRAPLGAVTVFGNHDHWSKTADIRAALDADHVRILTNEAIRLGPLTIGGLDDLVTGHARQASLFAQMTAMPGPRLLLSHSPDAFPRTPEAIALTLAGHTHCGQIRLPLIGPLATGSLYGERYLCGLVQEKGRTLIVSAGLGTSIVPLRYGARPDLWLITLGPAER